jgi:SAM-dependent methyltransferase
MPVENNIADIVISNCVLNLVPDKSKAFSEMYRITKPGGRFCISDIVFEGEIPEVIRKSAEMYAGCVAGALQKNEYLSTITQAGFTNIKIKKSNPIELPDESLAAWGILDDVIKFREKGGGFFSITVTGSKE